MTVTDGELAKAADQHFRATKISYPDWLKKAYKGEPGAKPGVGPRSATEWQRGFDALAQIGAVPVSSSALYTLDLGPNWNNGADQDDIKNNLNAVWQYPGPSLYDPPNGADPYAVLLLDPRYQDRSGRAGVDEWWFQLRCGWPAGFDPSLGAFNTFGDAHNVAGDAGPPGSAGVGWAFGSGVSAFEMVWTPGSRVPAMHFEYAASGGLDVPVPAPTPGVVHVYDVRFRAGRTDGTTFRPGEYEILADDVPVAKASNVNTVQRAQGPDGNWYVQRWMAVPWCGYYTQDLKARSSCFFEMCGYGHTRAEAAASVTTVAASTFPTQKWNAKAPNLGPPTLTVTP